MKPRNIVKQVARVKSAKTLKKQWNSWKNENRETVKAGGTRANGNKKVRNSERSEDGENSENGKISKNGKNGENNGFSETVKLLGNGKTQKAAET